MFDLTKYGYEYDVVMNMWHHLDQKLPTPISDKEIYLGYVKEKNGKIEFSFPKYQTLKIGKIVIV